MARKQKKKPRSKKTPKSEINSVSTDEALAKNEIDSESIVRLKITIRKGARIESVPMKKLEKLASRKKLHWKLEGGWLTLIGLA